ncbi:cohesin complex subunit psm1 [Basidiobolus meristosporus CBS 931.73]|uniref:Structural maintenance of chromosomes protein n=1 Tax=Basidiobolus meristosporus CBS 931.73 TaxID=1314790 RepID=A0A1Y1YY57_9FUNG|nr:cohesin complex subunit psm1 [Basidiobolus meristosporus CBS 931.73]|eukprot:ORY02505.1 cohesin complex subunit psm1 [Basidiobolus meristosporus CBS 931.73]
MDAISFVLGVKSSQLRSSQLKDLIYRGRTLRKDESMEESTQEESMPTKAFVTAVYEDDSKQEIRFTRTITSSGSSEYKINDNVVTWARYNSVLEEQNILIKARNFLVFQGDVEAIASQSPRDLTRLIEQISGSLELKAEYERLKALQERATENSAFNFNKKRGIAAEMKQFQEQKAEAERFETLIREKSKCIVNHLVWRLFHIEKNVTSEEEAVDQDSVQLTEKQRDQSRLENQIRELKREQARIHRENLKLEMNIKKREREYEDRRPQLLSLEEKITHTQKKINQTETNITKLRKDLDRQTHSVSSLDVELDNVTKAEENYEASMRARSIGAAQLTDAQLAEYNQKKEEVRVQTYSEQQQLDNLQRQHKTNFESLQRIKEKVDQLERQRDKLKEDKTGLLDHKEKVQGQVGQISQELDKAKQNLANAVVERERIIQTELELNEKLSSTLNKLMEAKVDRRETEREQRMKECLETMKRIFPGVHGRLVDLCKPSQRKYDVAVSIVLGRNMDAIVVDQEKTAIDCIQYMREQRVGQATFLPLDTLVIKPINDKYRSFAKGARLAIDVIQHEAYLERALQYACGNALICDTLSVAKYICYERGQEVKTVTLDGTIIHKSGLITGGQSGLSSGAHRWEEKEIENLKRARDSLFSQLNELGRSKRRISNEEQYKSEISGLESRLEFTREDFNATKRKLASIDQELEHIDGELDELSPKLDQMSANIATFETEITRIKESIYHIEDSIFEEFCQSIGVSNVREYEESQLRSAQESAEMRMNFTIQRSRLQNQLEFERQQLVETTERLSKLQSLLVLDQNALEGLTSQKETHIRESQAISNDISELRRELLSADTVFGDKTDEINQIKKQLNVVMRELDRLMKEMAAKESVIEKLNVERTSIFRRCKLEEIELPLARGSLEEVPLDDSERIRDPMDVDTATQTPTQSLSQRSFRSSDWTIEVDFSSLSRSQKETDSDELNNEFREKIRDIQAEIERLAPNLKVFDRMGDVQNRLRSTEEEFEEARREAKDAKEMFNSIKQQRYQKFYKAYSHIAEKIDQIYKDLTKSKTFPLGGTAYLSLEDSEEPYLDGVKYHAMPPMKRFRDMEQLSGGEKTVAALALLFAIHSYQPSPFFVLDEVDAALDNANVGKVANYIREHAGDNFQFVVISLKQSLYEKAQSLVGIHRDQDVNSSKVLTLDLTQYPVDES